MYEIETSIKIICGSFINLNLKLLRKKFSTWSKDSIEYTNEQVTK